MNKFSNINHVSQPTEDKVTVIVTLKTSAGEFSEEFQSQSSEQVVTILRLERLLVESGIRTQVWVLDNEGEPRHVALLTKQLEV